MDKQPVGNANLMNTMIDHAGTMKEWFEQTGAEMFFQWLIARRTESEKLLRSETDIPTIYRLQGELNGLDKIARLPNVIIERIKTGGK